MGAIFSKKRKPKSPEAGGGSNSDPPPSTSESTQPPAASKASPDPSPPSQTSAEPEKKEQPKKEEPKEESQDKQPETKEEEPEKEEKKEVEKKESTSTIQAKSREEPVPIKDVSLFNKEYTLSDFLGKGAFSTVRLCTHNETGDKFAVKIIQKKNVGSDMTRLQTEMNILRRVCHPNVIALTDIYDSEETLYIITELVTGGELFDKIVEKGSYSEADAVVLVSKMVSAIDYLHEMGIVHRDLKPENLLLKNKEDDSEVKLADFGLSKIVGQQVLMQTACGTPGYVAPEVLSATGYDKEVDMWSIGVITYILLCGFPPFYNENLPELFEQIMKADYDFPEDYWDEVSDDAKDFINHLLVVDPVKRMGSREALEHPWLKGQASTKQLSRGREKMKELVDKRQESKLELAK